MISNKQTIAMTSLVGKALEGKLPQLKINVYNTITQYARQIKSGLTKGSTARECLEGIWEFIENRQKENEQRLERDTPTMRISCRAGCAHCCRINVYITTLEATVILDHLEEKGMPLDKDYLNKQIAGGEDYKTNPSPSCVFLGDHNLCSVYEVRPIACRKYRVLSDPDMCNLQANGVKQVATEFLIDNECLASGLMNAAEDGLMPQMLLIEHQNRQTNGKETL